MKNLLRMSFALAFGLVTANVSADNSNTIEGSWVITAAEANGEKVTATGELSLKSGKYELKEGGKTTAGTYQLNASKKEIVVKEGGNTLHGLYELNGDSMTVCLGAEKPSGTKSTPNSNVKCVSAKRK